MACEFRAIWVLHQSSQSKDKGAGLLTARRFDTVEKRFAKHCETHSKAYIPIPNDKEVVKYFNTCILKEPWGTLGFESTLSGDSNNSDRVYYWDDHQEDDLVEKEWPLGPTGSLREIWPFIFISTNDSYTEKIKTLSDRYFLCGVIVCSDGRRPLIDLPEVTSGYRVLEDLALFLPSSPISKPHISVATKFQFYLKSALPFGSPFVTSSYLLEHLSDVTPQTSPVRIPSWRACVSTTPSIVSSTLCLEVNEQVSLCGDGSALLHGAVACDCDIPGVPEIIIPIDNPQEASLVTHACAKLQPGSVLCVPLPIQFDVCGYVKSLSGFPLGSRFSFFQMAPNRYKYDIIIDLCSINYSQFAVSFPVGAGARLVDQKGGELINSRLVWSTKLGGHAEGIVETEQIKIPEHARINFVKFEGNFSNIEILKKKISIFPKPHKNTINVQYTCIGEGIINNSHV